MLIRKLKIVWLLAFLAFAQGCGEAQKSAEKYPHTGDEEMEVLLNAAIESQEDLKKGERYYINVSSLRFRSAPNLSNDSRLGVLALNDVVEIVSTDVESPFVEVRIIETSSQVPRSDRYFLSYNYLSETPSRLFDFEGRYFMIQNIATEKLRVYERVCEDNSCPHRMILESDMAVGEDEDDIRTVLGSYRITTWEKFYQDYAGLYPSWYHPSYPDPPSNWRGIRSWTMRRYMPRVNGSRKGSMRGAFGWYTAKIGPNNHANWTHGTIGWGEKSADFIQRTRGFFANLALSPRSSGCSRVDNLTISYLREILPVGTPLIKIYAKEEFLDPSLSDYTQETSTWDYILTTREARRIGGETADREKVLARGVTEDEILEQGTYVIQMIPEKIDYTPAEDLRRFFSLRSDTARQSESSGNIYGVPEDEMHGVFYIDAGIVKDYRHPNVEHIEVGGFNNLIVPEFIDFKEINL